jgi:hypothetical protein
VTTSHPAADEARTCSGTNRGTGNAAGTSHYLTRSYHDLRHQPDCSAEEITIDRVWIRTIIITGDVACPTGCCDKATRAREGKKEGSKR